MGLAADVYGCGLPVGLAAFSWTRCVELRAVSRVFSEKLPPHPGRCPRQHTITWLTEPAISGARLYWESKSVFMSKAFPPVAVSAFPDEIDLCPRSWAERLSQTASTTTSSTRRHFAAWEQPQLFQTRFGAASVAALVRAECGAPTCAPPSLGDPQQLKLRESHAEVKSELFARS